MQFTLVSHGTNKNLLVNIDGENYVADQTHPNFAALLQAAVDGDEQALVDSFNVAAAVADRFERLSERVTVNGNSIYWDGDAIDNSLTRQVVRFLDEGLDDWEPLVRFFEKVMQNPQEHSREQLYRFVEGNDITIRNNGDIVLYKSVCSTDDGYKSIHSGRAIVNGEVKTGQIPQQIGDVVEMPRSGVAHDPSVACHTGLHAGAWEYVKSFGGNVKLKVAVNPRDVVSVPNDSHSQKVRVCRYTVLDAEVQPTVSAYESTVYDWEDEDDYWGDGESHDYDPGHEYALDY
jgi:hypothetical protein